MSHTTPTAPTHATILPLTWKTHESGDVDGNRVKAAGPVVVEIRPASQYGDAYQVTRPAPGSFEIFEDRGDYGTCLLDPWSDGHRHGLIRGKADGTLDHLGSYNTWKAAQFAAAAVAAGYDLTNADDLAEVRRQYQAQEHAKRMRKFDKKHGLNGLVTR